MFFGEYWMGLRGGYTRLPFCITAYAEGELSKNTRCSWRTVAKTVETLFFSQNQLWLREERLKTFKLQMDCFMVFNSWTRYQIDPTWAVKMKEMAIKQTEIVLGKTAAGIQIELPTNNDSAGFWCEATLSSARNCFFAEFCSTKKQSLSGTVIVLIYSLISELSFLVFRFWWNCGIMCVMWNLLCWTMPPCVEQKINQLDPTCGKASVPQHTRNLVKSIDAYWCLLMPIAIAFLEFPLPTHTRFRGLTFNSTNSDNKKRKSCAKKTCYIWITSSRSVDAKSFGVSIL